MPSIRKWFTDQKISLYEFQAAEELVIESLLSPDCFSDDEEEKPYRGAASTPEANSPVDYAKLQADAIIADAHQQALELQERAKLDLEPELDHMRQAAQQEGYQAGYTAGLAGGYEHTRLDQEAHAQALEAQVAAFLQKATLAREEVLAQTQDELTDLAITVAEKVVKVSLKNSSDIIGRMIQSATEKLRRKEWVHIYIAGCDAKKMAQVTPSLTLALSALSDHVRIVPMADDEAGTCIIEMPDEIIDASASTQLSNIRSLLCDGRTTDS